MRQSRHGVSDRKLNPLSNNPSPDMNGSAGLVVMLDPIRQQILEDLKQTQARRVQGRHFVVYENRKADRRA